MLHIRRYYVDDTWTPQKLNVKIDAPEKISLEDFRAGPKEVSELGISMNCDQDSYLSIFVCVYRRMNYSSQTRESRR